jgi:hypothetical protein
VKDIDHLEFSCRVTDYKLEAKKLPNANEAGAPKTRESKEEKCAKYNNWLQVFKAKADVEDFFTYMETELKEFGTLKALFQHALATHNEVQGKSRELVKKRSAKIRKGISKELHPDKIPHACKDDVEDMVRAIFDRATTLKECIDKPSLCELVETKEEEPFLDEKLEDPPASKRRHGARGFRRGEL